MTTTAQTSLIANIQNKTSCLLLTIQIYVGAIIPTATHSMTSYPKNDGQIPMAQVEPLPAGEPDNYAAVIPTPVPTHQPPVNPSSYQQSTAYPSTTSQAGAPPPVPPVRRSNDNQQQAWYIFGGSIACTAGVCCCICCILPIIIFLVLFFTALAHSNEVVTSAFEDDFYQNNNYNN